MINRADLVTRLMTSSTATTITGMASGLTSNASASEVAAAALYLASDEATSVAGTTLMGGIAVGPMAPVARSLATIGDADVHAIAVYIGSLMSERKPAQLATSAAQTLNNEAGAGIFATSCASCHDGTQQLPYGGV